MIGTDGKSNDQVANEVMGAYKNYKRRMAEARKQIESKQKKRQSQEEKS